MRKALEGLSADIDNIGDDNDIYRSISRLKDALQRVLVHLDRALPIDKEDDQ